MRMVTVTVMAMVMATVTQAAGECCRRLAWVQGLTCLTCMFMAPPPIMITIMTTTAIATAMLRYCVGCPSRQALRS